MASSAKSEILWEQIVRDFRQACLLKRAGKFGEAARILEDALPLTINLWSQSCPRDSVSKRIELAAMFRREQQKIGEFVQAQQLAARQAIAELLPSLRADLQRDLTESVIATAASMSLAADTTHEGPLPRNLRWTPARARIPFDDIPGVIDAVQAEQMADFGARPAFAT